MPKQRQRKLDEVESELIDSLRSGDVPEALGAFQQILEEQEAAEEEDADDFESEEEE